MPSKAPRRWPSKPATGRFFVSARRRSFYASAIRPILWRLDPETAHNLVMRGMILLSWVIGVTERVHRVWWRFRRL